MDAANFRLVQKLLKFRFQVISPSLNSQGRNESTSFNQDDYDKLDEAHHMAAPWKCHNPGTSTREVAHIICPRSGALRIGPFPSAPRRQSPWVSNEASR